MKKFLLLVCLLTALCMPASAAGGVVETGEIDSDIIIPEVTESCSVETDASNEMNEDHQLNEKTEPHEHQWQLQDYDEDDHELLCSECQQTQWETHEWDDGFILSEPSTEAEGSKLYTCTSGCIKIESIPKLEEDIPSVPSETYILEQTYAAYGNYAVHSVEYDSQSQLFSKYKIWYPTQLESDVHGKYPVVIFANGTGVPYTQYEGVFEQLASWGFIAVGNDHLDSWKGDSSSISLDFILGLNLDKESIFFGKIAENNVGIFGHSQGGVGVINAVTEYDNSYRYKAAFAASTTQQDLSIGLGWPYDISKVNIPIFLVAGTKTWDSDIIAPLPSLIANYDALMSGIPAVRARRSGVDHGDMLTIAQGYMTAWFCYMLKGDTQAAQIFFGDMPELLENTHWQDVAIKDMKSVHQHSFKDYIYNDNATCIKNGTETAICENGCGVSDTREKPETVLGHRWDDGFITLEPTQNQTGIKTFTCTICGEKQEEILPVIVSDLETKVETEIEMETEIQTETEFQTETETISKNEDDSIGNNGNDKNSHLSEPKTGDNTNLFLFAIVAIMAILTIACVIVIKFYHRCSTYKKSQEEER